MKTTVHPEEYAYLFPENTQEYAERARIEGNAIVEIVRGQAGDHENCHDMTTLAQALGVKPKSAKPTQKFYLWQSDRDKLAKKRRVAEAKAVLEQAEENVKEAQQQVQQESSGKADDGKGNKPKDERQAHRKE